MNIQSNEFEEEKKEKEFFIIFLFAEAKGKKFITIWKRYTLKQEKLEKASNGTKNSHCYALEQEIATWNQGGKLKVKQKTFWRIWEGLLMLKILFLGSKVELIHMDAKLVFNRFLTELHSERFNISGKWHCVILV